MQRWKCQPANKSQYLLGFIQFFSVRAFQSMNADDVRFGCIVFFLLFLFIYAVCSLSLARYYIGIPNKHALHFAHDKWTSANDISLLPKMLEPNKSGCKGKMGWKASKWMNDSISKREKALFAHCPFSFSGEHTLQKCRCVQVSIQCVWGGWVDIILLEPTNIIANQLKFTQQKRS